MASGDVPAAEALGSDLFGLPTGNPLGSRDLKPVLQWCLKGSSEGRASEGTTYCDDLVLAVLGTTIMALASSPEKGIGLSRVLGEAGDAARETCLGQFITQVQGAKAMMAVREGTSSRGPGRTPGWAQGKELNSIAALLAGQVRSALGDASTERPVRLSARTVVTVFDQEGRNRRIDLRPPTTEDWALLNVARHVKDEADKHDGTWRSFAMMVLCAAQAEGGLFQMAKAPVKGRGGGGKRWRHMLCLSEEFGEAIRDDLDRWIRLGFTQAPMLCEPENGDYLTVKHRPIAGRRGPMGIRTEAEGTAAWEVASKVMAGSAWEVSTETLAFLRTDLGRELAAKSESNAVRLDMILGEASRLAAEDAPFYFPIQMDFRGRVYLRPQLVTYQGSDVQKGLLRFAGPGEFQPGLTEAIACQAANLYGAGAEKIPMADRKEWFLDSDTHAEDAEEPIQMWALTDAIKYDRPDTIPCQIDGTCNGLQHLSALFRDESAAPYVNLVGAAEKADVYARVAEIVGRRLGQLDASWARRVRAAITVDRKLTKKSVMVLPYGGTRGTIDECTLDAAAAQMEASPFAALIGNGSAFCPWRECLMPVGQIHDEVQWERDPEAVAGNYLAFKDRPLHSHPLFRLDMQRLGGLIWAAIEETLPKAMQAMQTFRAIAKAVGPRTLEWSTGFGPIHAVKPRGKLPRGTLPSEDRKIYGSELVTFDPLRVIQAKARSDTQGLRLKGFHLPGSVRGLAMKVGRDEVDPKAHVSGIVANFIHSMDACHLGRTMEAFQYGRTDRPMAFGAIHDCFITRPSMMEDLAFHTRETFAEMYRADPLSWGVRIRDVTYRAGGEDFPSWHALAAAMGVSFPDQGVWEPDEVLGSQWFFS